MLRTLVLPLALALTPLATMAQAPSASSASPSTAVAQAPVAAQAPGAESPAATAARPSATSADTGAVPVPQPTEKALRYFRGNTALWFVGILWGLLLPALALFTGLSARVRDFAERVGGRRWFFTVAIYGMIITLLAWLAGLPLAWYSEFVREHAYGLSNQTFGKWLGDSLKGLALSMIGIALVLWMPYLLLRRSPRRWWLWTGLGAIPLIVLLIFVSPIWIDPLFNRFGPMQDQRLESQILALAQPTPAGPSTRRTASGWSSRATTARRRRRLRGCRGKTCPCHTTARSTSCGTTTTRPSASASTSSTAIAPGPRGSR